MREGSRCGTNIAGWIRRSVLNYIVKWREPKCKHKSSSIRPRSIDGVLSPFHKGNQSGHYGQCKQNMDVAVQGGGSRHSQQPKTQKYDGNRPKHTQFPFEMLSTGTQVHLAPVALLAISVNLVDSHEPSIRNSHLRARCLTSTESSYSRPLQVKSDGKKTSIPSIL